jgi:hypothetical protein
MIHSKGYQPKVFPWGNGNPAEIDRAQDIGGDLGLNRDKVNEIGRTGVVGYRKRTPSFRYTLRQLEYGSLEFWKKLANKADSARYITLEDFKTSICEIASYLTDDSNAFTGTLWIPKTRVSGFGLNIGDPDAMIERSFELIGEDYKMLQEDNKYLIYLSDVVGTGETTKTIVIGAGSFATYPDPVENPDEAGKYILRLIRVRSGVASALEYGTGTDQFSYDNGTTTITINNCEVGDVIKAFYSASNYITGVNPFVVNDVDPDVLDAENVSIFLGSGNYLYRLQSCSIDGSLDRRDIKELGSTEVVQTGVRENTVNVTLGRLLERLTIEEVLRGVSAGYGLIDPRKFLDNISLIIKIFEDETKTTFKMGYKITNLTPTTIAQGTPLEDYANQNVTMTSDNLKVTDDEAEL